MSDDLAPDEPNINDLQAKLRIAEKRAKEAEEAKALADQVARENAFLKAGINPDDPKAKYFFKGYEGELSKDAILAEAQAAGIVAPPPPDPAGEALSRVADAAGGAELDGSQAAQKDAAYAAAKTPEEVMAIAEKYGVPTVWSIE